METTPRQYQSPPVSVKPKKLRRYPALPCGKCGADMPPLSSSWRGVRYECCGRIWERSHQTKELTKLGVHIPLGTYTPEPPEEKLHEPFGAGPITCSQCFHPIEPVMYTTNVGYFCKCGEAYLLFKDNLSMVVRHKGEHSFHKDNSHYSTTRTIDAEGRCTACKTKDATERHFYAKTGRCRTIGRAMRRCGRDLDYLRWAGIPIRKKKSLP